MTEKLRKFKNVYEIKALADKTPPMDEHDDGINILPELQVDNGVYVPDYPNGIYLLFTDNELKGQVLVDTDASLIKPNTRPNERILSEKQALEAI